ncbi:MAG TPA: histidine phosphatase family protein [Urbifossiella sp.]|jgi:broad specificity phosphatase PhoE|nr:histidine phosphatase family protein [Urbifossiella sp.]
MTTIWLTRHAETSAPTVFHGAESDIGLSDLGRRQAAAAAGWFAPLGVTAVVSSGMLRARDTAAPVAAACGAPHRIEPDLHERRVGALSGTAFSSTGGPWPETIDRWEAGDTAFTTPGAESFEDLRRRLVPAVARVAAAHPGGRVVVVAHGVVCKVLLLCLLPGYGPGAWKRLGRVPNLAVSTLTHAGGGGWGAAGLLDLPPPVAALSGGAPTGVGEKSQG